MLEMLPVVQIMEVNSYFVESAFRQQERKSAVKGLVGMRLQRSIAR